MQDRASGRDYDYDSDAFVESVSSLAAVIQERRQSTLGRQKS